ncbi:MAG: RNA-binding transcriptional accessory protein [Ruminococcaceae bacterium]|nr:RNA-binding transcriptional accessory protein [Oscillospiraceae bacterium]
MDIIKKLTEELGINEWQTVKAVELIDEGNTIPFIARYRKEATGSLDDVQLRELYERLDYLRRFEERKEEIRAAIEGQGKLTDEIVAALEAAQTLNELEDVYLPYKQKRKTRASVARERGLEPLALMIFACEAEYDPSILKAAEDFVDEEKEVSDVEAALAGACDIIAEDIAQNATFRKVIREGSARLGELTSSAAKEEDSVYAMYYNYAEPVNKVRSHRYLAIARGEREEFLKVSLKVPEETVYAYLEREIITNKDSEAAPYLRETIKDAYKRLIAPAIEREIRADLLETASDGAIDVFASNLRGLLMQPPVRGKVVMGYDPGYRTGCKLAVVDETGKVLETAVIYPTKPYERIEESRRKVVDLIRRHGVDVISIGNGTASRESEQFIADTIKTIPQDVKYVVVSEAGASVYSASKLAQDEFPDFDVTERSAVSIARRLIDPLAELVKIEPKAIGVGQYQHDMQPKKLDFALGGVVEDCVNGVGVELNTASHSLLSYVAGISAACAKNIVKYREEKGAFKNREELKKVSRLGDKVFEQCAGFLLVSGGEEILDCTGVHPESYTAARGLLRMFDYTEDDVRAMRLGGLSGKVAREGAASVAEKLGIGEPTLIDICTELEKPGRDPRDGLPAPVLRADVMSFDDLKEGMELRGTVRNVVDFGAFVDIGVHQDGLLHISEIADKFVKHPSDVLTVGDVINVKVKSIDKAKHRIGLTMRSDKN